MRKLLKFLSEIFIISLLLIGGGRIALKHYVSPQKIQNWVAQYAKENWNREVSFHSVSFNWIGLTLRDFSLSEENSFTNGTFIQARTLVAKVAIKPLLKKRIEINTLQLDGLELNLVQQRDGNFNFSSFVTKVIFILQSIIDFLEIVLPLEYLSIIGSSVNLISDSSSPLNIK